jgi:hypothetical protein
LVVLFVVKHILPNGFGHVYFLPCFLFAQFIVPYLVLPFSLAIGQYIRILAGWSWEKDERQIFTCLVMLNFSFLLLYPNY